MTRSEFLRQAMAAAKAASAKSGFPAGITVAQAALESAWGQSRLSREANNYFGIKAYGKRDRVAMPTHEVENGTVKAVTAEFAKFESMAECFAARDKLIATSSLFAEARACPANAEEFARAIAKHWATDPGYAEKIMAIYGRFKLHSLDESAVAALGSA
ncbi:MAG: glucosaminidase domain-containing protein [Candidatus Korobacteraceae bacterium]|jgi:flagellum-specific peptidoglycan hydrolase FlgJ